MAVLTVEVGNSDLSRLVDRVQQADELVLTKNGRPVARITSIVDDQNFGASIFPEGVPLPQPPRFYISEDGDAMEQEIAAYEANHAALVTQYLQQYVAIYQGQVVDHDVNQSALLTRIDQKYPDVIVLIRKVEQTLPGPIYHRSPRFEKHL